MSETPLRYHLEIDGRRWTAPEVRGDERISAPFRIELSVLVEEGPFDPDALVRQGAAVILARTAVGARGREVADRTIRGVVTDVAIAAARRGGVRRATVVVEPRLALARLRADLKVFRHLSVPQIVTEVLAAVGVTPELRLVGAYAKRDYCVQHRETDLDFVHRLLEDEGIFYFFAESGGMVLGDDATSYDVIAGRRAIPFRQVHGASQGEDAVVELGDRAAMSAGRVALRDFDPARPKLDMDASSATASPGGAEWYDFPGEYGEPSVGASRAGLFADAIACSSAGFAGRSLAARLLPGAIFDLTSAPEGLRDGGYVVTRVTHDFSSSAGGFSCGFEASRADVTWRPARATPAPRILGPMTGFVTGPPGADIHTDEWGRVKVHLHWDRVRPFDDDCSAWIPVLQDNTGESSAIPRVGWEVVVHFLEGDPDRPVVLGRVYNGLDPFPEKLPDFKTHTALRSLSTPSRNGRNEIRFRDEASGQHIQVFAQKDEVMHVANDKREIIVSTEQHEIDRHETISIGNDHKMTVLGDARTITGGDKSVTVGGSSAKKVVGGDGVNVAGDRTMTIGGMHSRRIGTTDAVTAKNIHELIGAIDLETSLGGNTTTGQVVTAMTVGGAVIEIAKASKSEATRSVRAETIGGVVMTKAVDIGTTAAVSRQTTTGMLKVDAKEEISISGIESNAFELGAGAFTGAKSMLLRVGKTSVALKDGALAVDAGSSIKISISGKNAQGAGTSKQNSE